MEEKTNVDETVELTQQERLDQYSQELFGKPAKDIKYLLLTNYIHDQLLQEELTRTGLYQWLNVFNGEVKQPRDVIDYNEYDIIQVNMSAQDLGEGGSVKELLKEDSKTRIVINNDYTTEMWGQSFGRPDVMKRELAYADMIFGTEYYQATALTEVSNRKVYIIPHPADIKRLKHLPALQKKNIISTVWRRYDNHAYIPSLVARNHGMTTQLIGYDKSRDPKMWLTTTLYDYVYAGTNYFDYCDQMRESAVVYDPFTYHSYNRGVVDCAAMGVPVVGSDRTQSVNVCFPFTKVDPYDVTAGRKMIEKLLNDKEFYDKVVKYAKEHAEYYNHANSMEKYLMALSEAVAEGKIKSYTPVEKTTLDKGRGDDVNHIIANEKTRK